MGRETGTQKQPLGVPLQNNVYRKDKKTEQGKEKHSLHQGSLQLHEVLSVRSKIWEFEQPKIGGIT